MTNDVYERGMQRLQEVLDGPIQRRAPTTEHLLLKAATIAADKGTFEAVISTSSVDREKDIVDPDAMVRALHAWTTTGKLIPLAWDHSTKAEDIIGHVVPASAKAIDNEVHVEGWIDQSIPRGKDAWRLIKSGTLGFSFGYIVLDADRSSDVRTITELDLFEVSATPTPMNNTTRVTAWKSTDPDRDEPPSLDELRARERELDLDGAETLRREIAAHLRDIMTAATNDTHGNGGSTHPDDAKTLRARAEKAAREAGPITVASFDC
jgi:HK97 family phage prohead protease